MTRPQQLLSVKKVAAMLDISERAVYRLVKEGKLSKPRRVGGVIRWFPKDLAVFWWRLARGDFEMGSDAKDGQGVSKSCQVVAPAKPAVEPRRPDARIRRNDSP